MGPALLEPGEVAFCCRCWLSAPKGPIRSRPGCLAAGGTRKRLSSGFHRKQGGKGRAANPGGKDGARPACCSKAQGDRNPSSCLRGGTCGWTIRPLWTSGYRGWSIKGGTRARIIACPGVGLRAWKSADRAGMDFRWFAVVAGPARRCLAIVWKSPSSLTRLLRLAVVFKPGHVGLPWALLAKFSRET